MKSSEFFLGRMLISILFPKRCPICDGILEPEESEDKIHSVCRLKLYPVSGPVCMRCGRPLSNPGEEYCFDCNKKNAVQGSVMQGKALYLYQGAVKQAMYRFKYSNKREYADFFAEQVLKRYGEWMHQKGIEVIIPVPMYPKKKKKRGYNQAEVFARELSRYTGIPMDAGLVCRVKDTTPQKELDDAERRKNLKNAFQIRGNIVQYKQILIVDDIYTTGSTVSAIAEALTKAKACQVYALNICIGKGM